MKQESKDVRGDETMSVHRVDSAYDPNPGFTLDLVYNLVFKLAAKYQIVSRQYPLAIRSLFLDEASRCWI